jgi:hypothetical protein
MAKENIKKIIVFEGYNPDYNVKQHKKKKYYEIIDAFIYNAF